MVGKCDDIDVLTVEKCEKASTTMVGKCDKIDV
jgi:hypothetical protein